PTETAVRRLCPPYYCWSSRINVLRGIHASYATENGKRPLHGRRRRCCYHVVYQTSRLHCFHIRRTCVRRRNAWIAAATADRPDQLSRAADAGWCPPRSWWLEPRPSYCG